MIAGVSAKRHHLGLASDTDALQRPVSKSSPEKIDEVLHFRHTQQKSTAKKGRRTERDRKEQRA